MELLVVLQIIVAVLLSIGILLQDTGSGIEGALGGGSSFESVHTTRRGFDLVIFHFTIIMAVAFTVIGVLLIIF